MPTPQFLKTLRDSFKQKRRELRYRFQHESPVFVSSQTKLDKRSFIGRYSYIGDARILGPIRIGRYCSIAHDFFAVAGNHPTGELTTHPFTHSNQLFGFDPVYRNIALKQKRLQASAAARNEPVLAAEIGNDVWIGTRVVMVGPVKIGNGAVIGACSLVNRDVPPYAVVVGTPAKVVRYRFEPHIIEKLEALRWWDLPLSEISNLPFDDVMACIIQLEAILAAKGCRL